VVDVQSKDPSAIARELAGLPGWQGDPIALRKTYVFSDFAAAWRFVDQVAEAAQALDHHPEIVWRYNQVTVVTTTHRVGAVTDLDLELARRLEALSSARSDPTAP
jgi:4a-hydroxytetrahydrobiopterin dehydratase